MQIINFVITTCREVLLLMFKGFVLLYVCRECCTYLLMLYMNINYGR